MRRLTKWLNGWFGARNDRPAAAVRVLQGLVALEDRVVPSGSQIFAVGAGMTGGPRVEVFNTSGAKIADFLAYSPAFRGGVHVAVADVNGDGIDDVITGAGFGGGPHVKVFAGVGSNGTVTSIDTANPIASFMAYDIMFNGGIWVAGADLNGDGSADIVTGAGSGGGPHVKVFAAQGTGVDTANPIASFMAYGIGFRGGVHVAAADGLLAVAPGMMGGPNVKVWNTLDAGGKFAGINAGAPVADFMAFNPSFEGGAYVTFADVNGDGSNDLVVSPGEFDPTSGPGPVLGPVVDVFANNGTNAAPSFGTGTPLATFTAGPAGYTGGLHLGTVRVGTQDVILTGLGRYSIDPNGNTDTLDLDQNNDGQPDRPQFQALTFQGGQLAVENTLSGNLDAAFLGGVNVST
jgi:hypothetical protein